MTFNVAGAKAVINLYEWLPGHGENDVNIFSDGSDLIVEILYESDDENGKLFKREIRFDGVCSFYKSLFPGAAGLINISYGSKWKIGSLIEFEKSDVADSWRAHLPDNPTIKHYLMQFTEANTQIHVVASGFVLSDAISLN